MSESASSGLGSSQGPHQVTWAKIESDSPFGVRSRFQLVADGEGHVVAIGKIYINILNRDPEELIFKNTPEECHRDLDELNTDFLCRMQCRTMVAADAIIICSFVVAVRCLKTGGSFHSG